MIRAMTALLIVLPCAVFAAPGDILFSDNFEDGTLAPWTTSNGFRSGVSNSGGFAGSGSFGAFTRFQTVTVTSPSFNAAVPEARLRMWIRRGADSFSEDTDANEDFVVEYRRANNTWGVLNTYLGSGTNGQVYNASFTLPADARHGNLAIRVRQTGGSGITYDYWHFDDVIVDEIAPAGPLDVGVCDDFENGLSTNWTVNQTSGFAGANTATSSSPSNSMFINGGVVNVQSVSVDTTDPTFTDISLWIRRGSDSFSEDPDNGENLVVEYQNNVGTWIALESFSGNGPGGQIFSRTYTLPAAGLHATLRIRFRMTGGSGSSFDFWHVDDVCFNQDTSPVLNVEKRSAVSSDPVNGTSGPKAIPGAIVEYTVSLTNEGIGSVDTDSVEITDVVPPNTALFVDTSGGAPIAFVDGTPSSGLTYNYLSDLTFTDNAGGTGPFDYTPVPDADGYDPLVTGYRITLGGAMNGNNGGGDPNFDIVFQVRIE